MKNIPFNSNSKILGPPPKWITRWAWVVILTSIFSVIWLFSYVRLNKKLTIDIQLNGKLSGIQIDDKDLKCINFNFKKASGLNNIAAVVLIPSEEIKQLGNQKSVIKLNETSQLIPLNIIDISEITCMKNTYKLMRFKMDSVPNNLKNDINNGKVIHGKIIMEFSQSFFYGIFPGMAD